MDRYDLALDLYPLLEPNDDMHLAVQLREATLALLLAPPERVPVEARTLHVLLMLARDLGRVDESVYRYLAARLDELR